MSPQDALDALDVVRSEQIHSVRVVFADQHGVLRGKTIAASGLPAAFEQGIAVPGSLLHKDTGNVYAVALWEASGNSTLDALVGARNMVLRPDPSTLRVLPWVEGTALVLSDLETLEGRPVDLSPRGICARATGRLADRGLIFVAGLELEFHLYRAGSDGRLEPCHPGWDLLGEDRLDRIEGAIEPIRRGLSAMGIPPVTIEAELGPGQIELTFAPTRGVEVADQAVLVRSAIRHIARRNGHQATFMSRPRLTTESFPSGWHLHQSLSAEGRAGSAFTPSDEEDLLSELGRQWVAGLLEHAAASCLLTTPTVTGYKRYRPRAITPDRITWSREHRGAMLRVVGGAGDPATRVENRAGDPAANPYLYVASQMISGLDGVERSTVPPPATESPYEPAGGDLLPRSLGEAIDAFDASALYRNVLGDEVVEYLTTLKRSEWSRFCAAVTDWEQREYFELF
jgi:glutamine synthetase